MREGAVASWLVRSTPERAVRARALAGILCCVLGQDTLLSQCPLSTQVYQWVLANLMLGGNPLMSQHPIQGGGEIFLVTS